ncbi:leucine-rich repeat domain-containing protein [uncultured Eubacterium sp.]|uniref:leucine-rich repeat domain-containing protein n=1 Tax=uncultured Eubacterium sp. TaxID=165185 RepID=UPI00261A4648|nr:leucine-rich repeat domain-containing protein [uncultured Eubacterium sp.]
MKKLVSVALSAIMTVSVLAPCRGVMAQQAAESETVSTYSASRASDESKFIIDENGVITSYKGYKLTVTVPETINGIIPTKIGDGAFENNVVVRNITLPDSVTVIGKNAFKKSYVETVTANGVVELQDSCFAKSSLKSADFPKTEVEHNAFNGSNIASVNMPKLKNADGGFSDCKKLKTVKASSLESIANGAFGGCTALQKVYASKLKNFDSSDFSDSKTIEMLFLPSADTINLDVTHNMTLYCGDNWKNGGISNPNKYTLNIIGGDEVVALHTSDLDSDAYVHRSTDDIIDALGAQIRTRDNGLRFGFQMNTQKLNLFDLLLSATNAEFGFVYTYDSLDGKTQEEQNQLLRAGKNGVHSKIGSNYNSSGFYFNYNAVFTGIPSNHLNDEISIRGYFCVDGMYIYSPVVSNSYADVALAVLNDEYVEQGIKNNVKLSLREV